MKTWLTTIILSLLLTGAFSTDAKAQKQFEITGQQVLGIRYIDLSNNSAKFNEYRDLRSGFQLDALSFTIREKGSGRYLDFSGSRLLLDNQSLAVTLGDRDRGWNLQVNHIKSPYRLSNKAMTPYIYRGGGTFTVSDRVSIVNDGNDTTGTPSLVPTTDQMAFNDSLVAEYLTTHLHPVALGTRREQTSAAISFSEMGPFSINLEYSDERRDGNQLSYGPIGDRPPRSLNSQIVEPVDYTTRELSARAEYGSARVQLQAGYSLSSFDNELDATRWDNIYFTPNAGADYATTVPGTARNVAAYGQRSLAPDNVSHQLSLATGINPTFGGRFTSTVIWAYMRQNQELLPYSASTLGGDVNGDGLDWNDTGKLPRDKANAKMTTLRINAAYSFNPLRRLTVRPFIRFYNLDNNTPTEEWKYVTQDVAGTNGDVNYRSYRRNLAYAYQKLAFGAEARQSVSFWRTTVGLGYTREGIDRDFREASTDENIFEISLRTKPANPVSFSAKYRYGDRKGDGYNYRVTSQTYWYTFDQGANEVDNPQFLFADHPDLRRYDVSDRKRHELNLSGNVIASQNLDFSVSYRYRNDDFDSGVEAVAPLMGTSVPLPNPADTAAMTPGLQIGRLKDKIHTVTVDVHYTLSDRWTVTAFADREELTGDARGMVYNENQRREPSNTGIQSPTALGPWTDPDRLYTTMSDQSTNTIGLGVVFDAIPGKLRLFTDYSLSRTTVDLEYDGYGSDADYLGRDWETFQFGFGSPETVRFNQYELNMALEYRLSQNLAFKISYLFNWYRVQDWMQEPDGPWVEEVGSEYYWRDTSRDNRWGNRLISMGGYLAPDYEAHVGFASLTYGF